MQQRERLLRAFSLAASHHRGQVDKAGRDYLWHPLRVAGRTTLVAAANQLSEEETESLAIIALMHDLVEDTTVTLEQIRLQFGEMEAEAVALLTGKPQGLSYLENIQRIVLSGNVRAMIVKFADNQDNNDPMRGLPVAERYGQSMDVLAGALRDRHGIIVR